MRHPARNDSLLPGDGMTLLQARGSPTPAPPRRPTHRHLQNPDASPDLPHVCARAVYAGLEPGRIWRALSYSFWSQGFGFVGEGFWPSYESDDAVSTGFVLTTRPLIFPRETGEVDRDEVARRRGMVGWARC